MIFSSRFRRKRKSSINRIISLTLVFLLLVTSVPLLPGVDVLTEKAFASTNVQIVPSEINTDEKGTAEIRFKFNAADDGQDKHATKINVCKPQPNGAPPELLGLIASGDYATKLGKDYIEHKVEWDGKINGVALTEGRYNICVSPATYNGIGVYYGQIGSFEIVNSAQPKAPSSMTVESGSSAGKALVKGASQAGTTIDLEIRYSLGDQKQSVNNIPVNAQGQWSSEISLDAGKIAHITAKTKKGTLVSSYSEVLKVMNVSVPSFPLTWEALASYYYATDSVASTRAKAVEVATLNHVTGTVPGTITGVTSLILQDPEVIDPITQGDLSKFTEAAIKKRLRIVNPLGQDYVEPARGDFTFTTDSMVLQALMPLQFGLNYLSRDPYEGAIGLGWHHSYEWSLTAVDGKMELMQPDGSRYEFVPLTGGRYLTPRGTELTLSQASSGGYDLQTPEGEHYAFNVGGLLTSITDSNHNQITFSYQGKLLQAVSTDGASLALSYNANNQLSTVTDHTNRKLQYGYSAAKDMTSFTDVNGAVTKFSYDSAHHVTGVTDPNQTASMNVTYDQQMRVTSFTDFYGSKSTSSYEGKVAPVVRGEDEEEPLPSGPVSINPNNGRDIADSDKVLLSGTMHNLQHAPPYMIVDGLKPAITGYMGSLSTDIHAKMSMYEQSAVSVNSDMSAVQAAIQASNSNPVVIKTGSLNVENGVTLGSPTKPVVLIADGMNTNKDMTITVYGTLIVKQALNANTKLTLNAISVGNNYGNIWVDGTLHLNNDSAVTVADTLYAGSLTYNSGQLTVDANRVVVQGELHINTEVIMNIAKEMILGGLVSNNLVADINIPGGDLFVRDNVSVNNQMKVKTGGVFAIGGDMTPNKTPQVQSGIGSGKTILTYPVDGSNTNTSGTSGGQTSRIPANVSATLVSVGKTYHTDALNHKTGYEWNDRFLMSEIRNANGSTTALSYDDADRLIAVKDGNGSVQQMVFDERGNVIQSVDGNQESTLIRYNALNRPIEVVDSLGYKNSYSYDPAGNLTQTADALGNITTVDYDNRGIPTVMKDALGAITTITNDVDGFAKAVQDPTGYVTQVTRDPLHRVTETSDAQGTLGKIEYDLKGRIVAQEDALQQASSMTYDDNGNVVTQRNVAGGTTNYSYDVNRLTSTVDALQNTSATTYDAVGNVVEERDENGGVTKYQYDSMGQMVKATDPEGHVTSYTYDAAGNQLTSTDAKGNTTTNTYNSRNQLMTVTNALNEVTQYKYDANGQIKKVTNPLGNITWYDYDALGRLTAKTDALGIKTEYEYDENGNTLSTLTDNTKWQTIYDERGLEIASIDPMDRKTTMTRDGRGRVTDVQEPSGSKTHYEYDVVDRNTSIRNALGHETTYAYDALGQVNRILDANNKETKFEYDMLGSLMKVTNAAGNATSYTYDALGNLLTKTDALGHVTSYSYNKLNQVEQSVNPLQEKTTITYDANGNQTSMVYPDQLTTTYSYDAVNRLDQIIYGDGQQVSYKYDAAGRRVSMKDSSGDTRYTFDALDRLTEVIDGKDKNIRYEWTATGERSRIIYPDNTEVKYSYDKSGQIEQVTDGTGLKTDYTYDANGRLASKSLPNNTQSTYNYDAVGQVVEIKNEGPGGTLLEQLKYTYDPAGNQLHSERQSGGSDEDNPTGATQPAEIADYMYDALNQLTHVQKLNGATTDYSYDAVGNRVNVAVNEAGILSTEDYTYDSANKLMRWTKGSDYRDYTYDLRGNLLDVVGIDSAAALKSLRMGITSNTPLIGPSVTTSVYGLGIDPNASVGGTNTIDPNAGLGGNVIDPNAVIDPNVTGVVDPNAGIDPNASLGGVVDPWVVDPLTGLSVTSSVYGIDPTALNGLMSKALSGPRTIESNRWDGANRLIGNTNYSGDQTTYGYDGDSNRVSMSVTLGTGTKQSNYPSSNPAGMRDGWEPQYKKQQTDIYFTNDTTMSLPEPLMATDASGNKWKQSYVYGAGGERISMSYLPSADASTDWEPTPGASGAAGNTTPKTLFYMSDIRGSAIGLLGADGSVSARYHYDEFGVTTDTKKFDLNWAGPDNLFGYTGLGYDFNSGYSYARARYIDSEAGRFISEDTYEGDIKNPLSLNLYTYVENNPLRYTDPSGHKVKTMPTGTWVANMKMATHCASVGASTCWKEVKAGTIEASMAVADFLIIDDINTIIDPNASSFNKTLAIVGFIPVGKVYKGGKLIIKLVSGEGRKIERAVELTTNNLNKASKIPCNCFTAGTKVLTDEGEKPIEDIQVGDMVLSKSDETGEVAYKEVVGLFQKQAEEIYYIHIGDEIIEVTGEHPFWLDGKGWTFVKDLKPGDLLVSSDGSKLAVDRIEKEPRKATVYNFMVAEYQSYFVSNLGIWVHNCFVNPGLVISDKKAGQKLVQHLRDDWGLDPSVAANRDWIKNYATDIYKKYDEVRTNTWRAVSGGTDGPALFYRKGNDVVVTDLQGNFVTILKDGATQNIRFIGGTVLDAR